MTCKYFGKCGGCSFQDVSYNTQLANKEKIVSNLLGVDVKVFSGNDFGYRNRMDMIFHPKGIGFRKKRDWKTIVDIDSCLISNDKLNKLIKELRDFFTLVDAFDIKKQEGTFKYAVIRTPSLSSSISFVLNEKSSRLADAVSKIKEFAKITSAENVVVTYVPRKSDISVSSDFFVVKGTEYLQEEICDKKLKYHVQGFFQNNSEMANKMVSYVKDKVGGDSLLDLYGGVGTFGICCAEKYNHTLIVELVEESIKAAKENILDNNVNAEARVMDAKGLSKLDFKGHVIVDPPRSGMHKDTIATLNQMKPEKLIYISCNPQQLRKDLNKLKFDIKSVALFDLFPQTPHMEVVVELEYRK